MSEHDKVFSGSIPDIYDDYLVPLIFQFYADDLAKRATAMSPLTVLETEAGSGVVTRALAPLLDQDTSYTVTDLNQPMLDRAKNRQAPDRRISWQQADALALPFDDGGFDIVCCQFGVMFFPDRVAGYKEARRILRPGGRLLFNAWDRIEENVFAGIVTEEARNHFPDDPPQFLARTPHGYHDTAQIVRDVREAGFADVAIDTVEAQSIAPTSRHPAIAYCQGTPLRNEIEARDPAALDEVTDSAAAAITDRFGTGPVSAKMQAHIVTATL